MGRNELSSRAQTAIMESIGKKNMETLQAVYRFFWTTGKTPAPWGVYHILWVGIVLACIFLIARGRKALRRGRLCARLTGAGCAVLFVLEAIKQLMYLFKLSDGALVVDYTWSVFPFQFCTTPVYVGLAVFFLPEGATKRAFCAFLAAFGLFGGVTILLYPNAVFTQYEYLNLHTMLWHCGLILIGVLQWAGGTFRTDVRDFLGAAALFLALVLVALALDLALPFLADERFNMFYISPYTPCTILFLAKVWEVAPYPLFFLLYAGGFVLIAFVFFLTGKVLTRQRKSALIPVN